MKYKQISIFECLETNEMYDGYEVRENASIRLDVGGIHALTQGQLFYFVTRQKDLYCISQPNDYGGSIGFTITEKQFKDNFKYLGKKIYPKRKEIWDGKNWVKNPELN